MGPRGEAVEDVGRCRAVLSCLYGASGALDEASSMAAVAQQLQSIEAFTSPHRWAKRDWGGRNWKKS